MGCGKVVGLVDSEGAKLGNEDVVFLMRLVTANLEGAYLVPGKAWPREDFNRYQHGLLLKLRALDLDALYEAPKEASR